MLRECDDWFLPTQVLSVIMVVVEPDGMVVGGLLGGVQTRGVVTLVGSGMLWRRVNH